MTARPHAAVEAPDRERRALVLAGGGIIGVLYEIRVLAALEEAFPPGPFSQHFDLFVGTSAGAVTAAFVANGAQPSEMFRAVRDDLDSPFNFRPEDVFGAPAGNVIQLFTQFARPLLGAVGGAIRRGSRATLASMLADFQAHHPPGFYSTKPLERALGARFTALGYPHHFPGSRAGHRRATMRTSKNIMAIENDRAKLSPTKHRIVTVGLALGILTVAARPVHVANAGTSPTSPVSKCSDFGCEQ